jgi:hypothetical protein
MAEATIPASIRTIDRTESMKFLLFIKSSFPLRGITYSFILHKKGFESKPFFAFAKEYSRG